MSGFFNVDNPFFSVIGKIVDIIILSVIWSLMGAIAAFCGYLVFDSEQIILLFMVMFIIAMIPVGPATTALYYSIVKAVRKDRGYPVKEFFHSFKANFKQGAIVSVLVGVIIMFLYFDFTYVITMQGEESSTMYSLMLSGLILVTILALFILMFLFPVLSRFSLTMKQLLKNSLIMSLRHMLTSLLLVINFLVFAFITWFLTTSYLPIFIITPGVCCLISSFLIERVFKKYMGKSEGNPEETGRDEWYLE